MILHHVAQNARVLEVGPAALDPDRLGARDLDVIDVFLVPQGLENAVGEPEHQKVLDGFLAQVMIDAIDLALVGYLRDLAIESARARQIGAERLFDDDARKRPLALAVHKAARTQTRDDFGKRLRGRGQIEHAIARDAALLVDLAQALLEPLVGGRVVEVALVVENARLEALPQLRINRPAARKLVAAGAHAL